MTNTWRGRNGAQYTYDPATNIASIEFEAKLGKYWIETVQDMRMHFEDVTAFWRKHCQGKKVYWLLNYDNFEVNRDVIPQYVEDLKQVMQETAVAAVRYGGAFNQRTTSRFTTMKTHHPSNIYESREEALTVIAELKAGTRKVG